MKKTKKILIVNGPNLQLLGKREPEIYGSKTLDDIAKELDETALNSGFQLEFFQSCIEGEIVKKLGDLLLNQSADGVILNCGAYSHTSLAIFDALKAQKVPCIEVHLSNIHSREEFRHKSITAGACCGIIAGFGANSYKLALLELGFILN